MWEMQNYSKLTVNYSTEERENYDILDNYNKKEFLERERDDL